MNYREQFLKFRMFLQNNTTKYIKRDVFTQAIQIHQYIDDVWLKKIKSDYTYQFHNPKYIKKVDMMFLELERRVLNRSRELSPAYSNDLLSWISCTWERYLNDESDYSQMALLNKLSERLEYFSDRMCFERFVHVKMLWTFIRHRLLFQDEKIYCEWDEDDVNDNEYYKGPNWENHIAEKKQ